MQSIMGFFPVSVILLGFVSSSLAIQCFVCNSEIDAGCKKTEGKDLAKFGMDCGTQANGSNAFLTTLYGDLSDGRRPEAIDKLLTDSSLKRTVGWTSVEGTPHVIPPPTGPLAGLSLNQNHLYARLRKKGGKLLKMPEYNACRVLRISVAHSNYITKSQELKVKSIAEDDPRVVRLCGWFNKDSNYNEETPGNEKLYKGKGGSVAARVCITELCNGTTKFGLPLGTILLSVLVSMFVTN